MLAHFLVFVVVLDVVVAIGQGEPALIDIGDDLLGVVQIGCGKEVEQRISTDHVGVRNGVHEGAFIGNRRDPGQFGLQGIEAFGIGGFFVHAGTVVVADFLLDGSARGAADGRLLQDSAQGHQVALVKFGEADPLGLIGWNLGVLEPVAAGVLVKVDAWIGGLVDGIEAETRVGLIAGGRLRYR